MTEECRLIFQVSPGPRIMMSFPDLTDSTIPYLASIAWSASSFAVEPVAWKVIVSSVKSSEWHLK